MNEVLDAEGAEFLITGEEEGERMIELIFGDGEEGVHGEGEKTLHVAGAAGVETIVLFGEGEGV